MKKYRVYAMYTGTKDMGVFESETEAEAIQQVMDDPDAETYVSLCYHCADLIDVSESHEFHADLVEDDND